MHSGLRQVLMVARREVRQGKSIFILSMLTTMLASAMLAAVLGLGDSLRATLARDAVSILGGHFDIRLNSRSFKQEELAWLRANTERMSNVTFIRAAAFTDEMTALLQVRAIDNAYPLFGELGVATGTYAHAQLLEELDEAIPGLVSVDLAASLGIGVGERFQLGSAVVEIVGLVTTVPDPNSTMLLNAPVAYIAAVNLPATSMHLPGTLKTDRVRVNLGAQDKAQWRATLNAKFLDNDWRVRGTDRVVPGLQNMLARMETLMLLVSLGTMLIAGICVSNTVSTYLRSRIASIAILRSLGMGASRIRMAYWLVSMLFVSLGAVLGLPLGLAGQLAIIDFLAGQLPFAVTAEFSWRNIILIPSIAILIAWIFAERPLQSFCRVSPTTLFSLSSGMGELETNVPKMARLGVLLPSAILALLLALVSRDKLFLLYFGVGGALATLLFRQLAHILVKLLGKLRLSGVANKIALRSITRGGEHIVAASVSLGIGLTALLTFSLTEANFNHQLNANLAVKTPDYYLVGLQSGDEARLREATRAWLPTRQDFRTLPTQRARITHFKKVPVEELDIPEEYRWIVRGDRYFTWSADPVNEWTGTSRISAGEPWSLDNDRLLVSFDAEAAEGFGLKIGDLVGVRILGVDYDVTIANLRRIDWSTFDVNFVMVLSDGPWANEPHAYLGSVRNLDGEHFAYQRKVVETVPNVTPIRTKTIVASVTNLLKKIGILLQIVTLTATVSGVCVLAAAIAEGRHRRAHEAVVLRILGTSHAVLAAVFRVEFIVIATLAALPAVVVGMLASFAITDLLLKIPWVTDWMILGAIMTGTLMTVLVLGSLSTMQLVRTPPLSLLRNN